MKQGMYSVWPGPAPLWGRVSHSPPQLDSQLGCESSFLFSAIERGGGVWFIFRCRNVRRMLGGGIDILVPGTLESPDGAPCALGSGNFWPPPPKYNHRQKNKIMPINKQIKKTKNIDLFKLHNGVVHPPTGLPLVPSRDAADQTKLGHVVDQVT